MTNGCSSAERTPKGIAAAVLRAVGSWWLPVTIVLAVLGPVAWASYYGIGLAALGFWTKTLMVAVPVGSLILDAYLLHRREQQPGFDPWSEI